MVVYVIWLGQSIHLPDQGAVAYPHSIIMMYCGFAFLATLLREIVKDLEDLEGDAKHGARTLPTVAGVEMTRRFTAAVDVALIATILYWLSKLMEDLGNWQLLYMAVLVVVPLMVILFLIQRAGTSEEWHRISQFIKVVILMGTLFLLLI